MNRLALASFLFAVTSVIAADPPRITFATGRAIPKGGRVAVVEAGKPGPGRKEYKPIASVTDFTVASELPNAGPFDVSFTPKGGLPVMVLAKWSAKPGTQTVSLSDHLGTVFVRGDDLPRANAVVVTATTDSGPGEKGHVAVQQAGDYKKDMVVPPGTYAVWVVPFNGAKAQRIADNIRVLAGRETKVE
jgi:hypothetical protein